MRASARAAVRRGTSTHAPGCHALRCRGCHAGWTTPRLTRASERASGRGGTPAAEGQAGSAGKAIKKKWQQGKEREQGKRERSARHRAHHQARAARWANRSHKRPTMSRYGAQHFAKPENALKRAEGESATRSVVGKPCKRRGHGVSRPQAPRRAPATRASVAAHGGDPKGEGVRCPRTEAARGVRDPTRRGGVAHLCAHRQLSCLASGSGGKQRSTRACWPAAVGGPCAPCHVRGA